MPALVRTRPYSYAWLLVALFAVCFGLIGPALLAGAETGPGPTPTSPPNGTKLDNLGPLLQWTQDQDATWYQIQVTPFNNDGPGINLIIGDTDAVTAESYQVREPAFGSADANYVMLPDMTYTWRVRTGTTQAQPMEADWTEWSVPFTFETANKFSNTISLQSPVGSTTDSLTPTLTWSNSDPTVFYYEVQVSRDAGFSSTPGAPMLYWELRHGGVTVPLNSYTIPASAPLQAGMTYYWRVRPRIQGDGTPVEWTAASSFQTSATARPTITPTATTTPGPTRTPTATGTPPTATATGTSGSPTGTVSPSVTGTVSPSVTGTITPSVTGTVSPSVTGTITPSVTGTITPSVTGTVSPTGTVTVTTTGTP